MPNSLVKPCASIASAPSLRARSARAVGKRRVRRAGPEFAQAGDEDVLERRRTRRRSSVSAIPRRPKAARTARSPVRRVANERIDAVAEDLHVDDAVGHCGQRVSAAGGIGSPDLEPAAAQPFFQLGRRAEVADRAVVEQRDPMAALGLVEIRRGDDDRDFRSARGRARIAQNSRRESGSTPTVGSSSKSTRGSLISAQHKRELLFHPAGELARRAGRRFRPDPSTPGNAGCVRRTRRPERRAARRCNAGSRRCSDRRRARTVGSDSRRSCARARGGSPSKRDRRRALGSSMPASTLKVVVLPAPSGPIRPKISPRCTLEIDPAHGLDVAVVLRQTAHAHVHRAALAIIVGRRRCARRPAFPAWRSLAARAGRASRRRPAARDRA